MLKPLLFWAGASATPFVTDPRAWERLAAPAVIVSDNDATAALWSTVGEAQLFGTIEERTGIGWHTEAGEEHPALRLVVSTEEVATAYATFAADEGDIAMRLRAWMRDVPESQTFGTRPVAHGVIGVPESSVAVKSGWFGLERAHAVTLVAAGDRTVGAVVMTARPADATSRAAAQTPAEDDLVALHDTFAGPSIRAGTERGLRLALAL
ncbi:MAG: hypothetical protein JJE52_10195 [Acidimicrobiia bacterium]|nr:hypothetical protein [Acidimicrobiia bacterium]